ncbi:hypothetical protein HYR54_07655 [Candidatus Acetothermia bacterium]|nr:hypothetical protein [Candidatus Acetothermia bacterium]
MAYQPPSNFMNFNISNISEWVGKLEFYEGIAGAFLVLYGLKHLSSKKDRLVGIGALAGGAYIILRSGNVLKLWDIKLPVLPFGQTSGGGNGGSAANRPL